MFWICEKFWILGLLLPPLIYGGGVVLSKARPDLMLLIGVITLSALGLVAVYSSSGILALYQYGNSLYFLKRQAIHLLLGIVLLLIGRSIDYHLWARLAKFLLFLGIILLCLTLTPFFGREINNAQRWIEIGPFSFQASEFMKLFLVIYLAELLSKKKGIITDFKRGFLPPLFIIAVISILIMMQPHVGMVFIMAFVGMSMIFLAGARLLHFFYLFVACLPLLYLLVFKFGYGKPRLISYIDPWKDPLGRGYQIIQSFIALGEGGLWGKGLGNSEQKLFYLPYPYTDFIYSIIGEEFGFLGAVMVVLLFLWFSLWGIKIAIKAKDSFGRLLGFGLFSMITTQALLNMGVVTGIFPTTGLPLPFISVGGSNLLVAMASCGILLNISKVSLLPNNGRPICGY